MAGNHAAMLLRFGEGKDEPSYRARPRLSTNDLQLSWLVDWLVVGGWWLVVGG